MVKWTDRQTGTHANNTSVIIQSAAALLTRMLYESAFELELSGNYDYRAVDGYIHYSYGAKKREN